MSFETVTCNLILGGISTLVSDVQQSIFQTHRKQYVIRGGPTSATLLTITELIQRSRSFTFQILPIPRLKSIIKKTIIKITLKTLTLKRSFFLDLSLSLSLQNPQKIQEFFKDSLFEDLDFVSLCEN